jgi:kinesin family member 4
LTRLLKNALGGNAMTVMIGCVSPADFNISETISTLLFASKASTVKNEIKVIF